LSLNHNKYLQTIDSERRQAATFPTVQYQLNRIHEDISLLFEIVEKLLDLHEKEHGIIERDPITAEIIIPTAATTEDQQPTTTTIKPKDSPYI
jgi:hypothetical protein